MGDFLVGQTVKIVKLGKTATVVAVLQSGDLRLLLGTMQITCKPGEIVHAATQEKKAKKTAPTSKRASLPSKISVSEKLDLHGKLVVDAIAKLDQWISDVALAGLERVQVVHGLGTGKVKDAVHRRLRELHVVKSFKVLDGNPGITEVYL